MAAIGQKPLSDGHFRTSPFSLITTDMYRLPTSFLEEKTNMSIRTRRVISAVAAVALGLGTVAATASSASAASCKTLKIAFQGPLTGDYGNLGVNISQGAVLAVDQYNAKNPKTRVQLVKYDSQADPAQAPALAQKIIRDACIVAMVGPSFSGETLESGPIYNRAGLPLISPSATNPTITQQGWKVFHRAVATDAMQGAQTAKLIKAKFAGKTLIVLDDASDYGKGLADTVRAEAAKLGITVDKGESIVPGAQDYSSTVAKVKASKAGVVYFGGYYSDAGKLAKQIADAGISAQFISDDGTYDKGFVTVAGAAAKGAIATAPSAPLALTKAGRTFQAAYKAAFGQADGVYSAEAFDAANFFLAGIKAGKVDRKSLLAYVKAGSYKGVTKTFKFGSNGELGGGAIYAYTVQADGSWKGELIK